MSAMDNVELQPDGASDAGTAFTRYTAMATTIGGSSMKSSCVALHVDYRVVLELTCRFAGEVLDRSDVLASRRLQERRVASTRRHTCSTRSRSLLRHDSASYRVSLASSQPRLASSLTCLLISSQPTSHHFFHFSSRSLLHLSERPPPSCNKSSPRSKHSSSSRATSSGPGERRNGQRNRRRNGGYASWVSGWRRGSRRKGPRGSSDQSWPRASGGWGCWMCCRGKGALIIKAFSHSSFCIRVCELVHRPDIACAESSPRSSVG